MKKIFILIGGLLLVLSSCKPLVDYAYTTIVTFQNNSGVDAVIVAYDGQEQHKFDLPQGDSKEAILFDEILLQPDVIPAIQYLGRRRDADSVQLIFDGQRVITYKSRYNGIWPQDWTATGECKCFIHGSVEITPEMYESAVPITK